MALPDLVTVVKALGAIACAIGLWACLRILRFRRGDLASGRVYHLGFVSLTAVAFYKLLAFWAFLVVPAAGVALANYHVFEGTHETRACMECHVMWPMGNDLKAPNSQTLAARHARNKWIAERQCYECHVDYGLAGSLEAKMDGYRHLARYTTGTYTEPIKFRGRYNNQNCLHCHSDTRRFEAVGSHRDVRDGLASNAISCLNCHGRAHPSREQRTPGSPDYASLMEPIWP